MTVKDYILQNIMHTEKNSNINCTEWWIPAKKVPDLNCRVQDLIRGSASQIRGAGSEIRQDPPPI